MTTNNHTALGLSAALWTQNADSVEKAAVLVALVISHLPADAIPHGHYYGFARLRQTWPEALIELGIGLIALPLIVWYFTSTSILWLFGCVFAASLFDFGVAAGIDIINRLNHFVHWWEKYLSTRSMWKWEIAQTIVLMAILYISILKYG